MTEPDISNNPNTNKKINIAYLLIAILVVVTLFQGIALIQQGKRQATLEKQQIAQQKNPIPNRALPYRFPSQQTSPQTAPPRPSSVFDDDPFEEFDAMSRRMSNIMRNTFMASTPMMQNLRHVMSRQGAGADFSPTVDLEHTKDSYIVRCDLPGLEKDKINLTVRDNTLTIEGVRQTGTETKDPNRGFYSQERSYGSFSRSLTLPGPVDESKITADYKNGVLTITLPKIEGQKNIQKVSIQ